MIPDGAKKRRFQSYATFITIFHKFQNPDGKCLVVLPTWAALQLLQLYLYITQVHKKFITFFKNLIQLLILK